MEFKVFSIFKIFSKKGKISFLAIAFIAAIQFCNAQSGEILPVDDKITIGKLENGFTYYIRENKRPENRIEIRLAVNAGSILEDEKQQGLAHFAEHMCFNGTKNFKKNELVQYLQSMGMKFGPEINAYTSFDETVYKLTVPADSSTLVEKSFLIMEDWAHNVSFEPEEIDKERGVVIEEWRIGQGPQQRMRDEYWPVLFHGSQYAERLPIGKKEILENFEHDELTRYYKDWYRPDLMALIVVGDIDAALAEEKIINHFSNLKMPKKPKERSSFDIPDHTGTVAKVVTDKEAPYTVVQLFFKSDTFNVSTSTDYLYSLQHSFITGMLNRRIQELGEQANPPFVGAGFMYGNLGARSKNSLMGYALVGEMGVERGLQTLMEETVRIDKFGFTKGEFERYKLDLLKNYEKAYNERDKTESSGLAAEYIRNFLENEPIPGISYEYELVKNNIKNFNLNEINTLASMLISSDNRIILVTGPEKETVVLPEEDAIIALAEQIDNTEILPYQDKLTNAKLLSEIPSAGSIIKETIIEEIDAVELILSNGAKVILKPTDFKNDEILLSAYALGGRSVFADEDHFSALHADGIISECGVSEFSNSDLTKILAGKSVNISTNISQELQYISGNCRPSDIETMMQLLFLKVTQPRYDEDMFHAYISKNKDLYMNLAQEPTNYFYDKFNHIRNQNHPRANYLPLESDWDKIDYQHVMEIYKQSFANAAELTFTLVGAFQVDSVKQLIAQYIGALPAIDREVTYKDLGIRPPVGSIKESIYKGADPKSLAIILLTSAEPYDKLDDFLIGQLKEQLSRKYIEVLREDMSGVYGVRVGASFSRIPYAEATMSIVIPCSPEKVDTLINAAINEIKNIQKNGVEEKDILKAREIYKREKERKLKENGYWLSNIQRSSIHNEDFSEISSFDYFEEITSENIKRVANKYFIFENYLQVVLYPEKTE